MSRKGFTLIELLVVVAIIGILATIVLASLASARTSAQVASTRKQMQNFMQADMVAQGEANATLLGMTGNGCSDCPCRTGLSLKGDTGSCYSSWTAILSTIQTRSNGIVAGLTNMTRDPWGSPYCIDENQGETGISGCSNTDGFRSVGPDGIWGTSDDISYALPLSPKCP